MSAANSGVIRWARAHVLGTLSLLLLGTAACSGGSSSPAAFGDDDFKRHGELRITPSEVRVREGDSVAVTATLVGGSGFDPAQVQWSVSPSHAGVIRNGHFVADYYGDVTIGASFSGTTSNAAAEILPAPHDIRLVGADFLAGTAGQALPDSVQVHVTGRNGVNVPELDVAFQVVSGDGIVSATQARTDIYGKAKVAWRLGSTAGGNELEAAIPGVGEARLEAWGYADLASAYVEVLDGNAQEGRVGEVLAQPLAIRVSDENGNPIRGVTVEWAFNGGDGSETGVFATPPQVGGVKARAVTDAGGVSQMYWRLGTVAGDQEGAAVIIASGSGAPAGGAAAAPGGGNGGKGGGNGKSDFTAKARPGHLDHIVVSPDQAELEVDGAKPLSAVAVDKWGNAMDATFEWSTANATIATIDPTQGVVEGEYPGATTASASYAGKSGTAEVVVLTGTPTAIVAGGGDQQGSTGAQLPQPLTAQVLDEFGAPIANVTVAWTIDSGGGSLSAYSSKTNSQGTASVQWTLGTSEGEQQARAAVNGIEPALYVATATKPAIASVTVSPSSLSLEAGGLLGQLSATTRDMSGVQLAVPVTWSSTNTAVATVDQNGRVTPISAGQAEIRASADGVTGSSAVSVVAADGDGDNDGGGAAISRVEATPASYTFTALGNTTTLSAVAYDTSGNPITTSFAWSSSAPDVVSVDQGGKLSAKMAGVAQILVCAAACSVADTVSVDVTQVTKAIEVTPEAVSLDVGQTKSLQAAVKDANGYAIAGAKVTWSSSNTSIATVDAAGVVTAKAEGTVTFQATADGVSDSSTGSVGEGAAGSTIALSPTSMSLAVGGQKQISAVVKDDAGNVIENPSIYWESSNTSIARVNSTGVVTAYESGSVTIKATSGTGTAAASVVVEGSGGTGVAFFEDGFESGGFSTALGGFRWTTTKNVIVSTGHARTGSRALRFSFGPDVPGSDSHSEARFDLPASQELWFEYYIYFPDGTEGLGSAAYAHRDDEGPDNNKLWKIAEQHGGASVTALLESNPSDVTGAISRARPMWGVPTDGIGSSSYGLKESDAIIKQSDLGRWTHFRFHLKVSDTGKANGVWRMWKNGELLVDGNGIANDPSDPTRNKYLTGYLMGWSNSGFSKATSVWIDDVKFYSSNPGW